jgi:fluoroacetyl-CoA thioesterase
LIGVVSTRAQRGGHYMGAMTPLSAGLQGTASTIVTADLTAEALGSGDVPVYGTPALLALIEKACCAAVAPALDEGHTTVGVWAELDHLAASRPGVTVTATASVIEVDGRTISFEAHVHEAGKLVGRAHHRRALVDRAQFLAR